MAGLEGNKGVKGLQMSMIGSQTYPVYKVPTHLMEGMEGNKFLVKFVENEEEEVARVVEKATKEVFRRTGSAGFPLLCADALEISIVRRGVERAKAKALVYHRDLPEESCSEVQVEDWLKRRRSGEEERVLIADGDVSRGWECSHVLVVELGGQGLENLVMRTVGYCALVKRSFTNDPDIDSDSDEE